MYQGIRLIRFGLSRQSDWKLFRYTFKRKGSGFQVRFTDRGRGVLYLGMVLERGEWFIQVYYYREMQGGLFGFTMREREVVYPSTT